MARKPLMFTIVDGRLHYWAVTSKNGRKYADWNPVTPEQMPLVAQAVQKLPTAALMELSDKLNAEAAE